MKNKINIRFITLIGTTIFVGLFRILQTSGHTPISNFTPIGAMALFGGAYFVSKKSAYLLPLLTLFLSDLVLMNTIYAEHSTGFLYQGWYMIYLAFGLMVLVGQKLKKKVTIKNVVVSGFLAALLHFIIVDFSVWFGGGMDITTGLPYTRNFSGLIKCYTLAIPYFKNMLAGNLIYSAVLFGGFELAKLKFPVLRLPIASYK